ncbi:hypothetical protein [Marivirga harenae]|uniref:hypothetical protein n=1 Tax=Marivirga harenae TaxID=2010992 RepID=UPI0026DEA4B5|nr:hypothetical protein [Marivirga harenae]WKV12222.1 hypothetical protein Q3Y49_18670 [Marivirga harenae]|tara:strand:- start:340829 stop:341266 length:438 start_codon:yes stop_codon:yes gene_type:complete
MKRFTLLLLIILLNLSCDKSDKFEKFIEEELNLNETQRSNQQFYVIDMKSCSGCLEINNSFLLKNEINRLNLVFIGNMERGGYFDRAEYESDNWNIYEVKEKDFFPYDIYSHDPLFLQFDGDGNTYSHQNIKVDEIRILDSLLEI